MSSTLSMVSKQKIKVRLLLDDSLLEETGA